MTVEEKIDEVLKVVRAQERNLLQVIREQGEKSEARDHQLLRLIQELEERHERRFHDIDGRFTRLEARLETKIDKVFDSLSQDIHVFTEDLHHVKKRVARLEKKHLS